MDNTDPFSSRRITKNEIIDKLKEIEPTKEPKILYDDLYSLLREIRFIQGYSIQLSIWEPCIKIQNTPSIESIEWLAEKYNKKLDDSLRKKINAISPREFEQFCVEFFKEIYSGSEGLRTTKGSDDKGIDFIGQYINEDSGEAQQIIGQAKHWKKSAGPKVLREFVGTIDSWSNTTKKSVQGIFVCTGGITPKALNVIKNSRYDIISYDINQIISKLREKNIGIIKQVIKFKDINERFWNEFKE